MGVLSVARGESLIWVSQARISVIVVKWDRENEIPLGEMIEKRG